MQDLDALPTPFRKLHQFLDPYVKDRHEAARIRRVLSTNLDSAVDPEARRPLLRPLSLTQASSIVESTPHGIKGSQKEYLRYLRANVKARRDYAEASKEHQPKIKKQSHTETLDGRGFCDGSLEEFLGLVRQQQKHEVLCIIQDYVDMLRKKPAAASDHLDPKVVLGGTVTLPQVPPEVINVHGTLQLSEGVDLKELTDRLEKSVLRAKMLLKKEQLLLVKVRDGKCRPATSSTSKLQALGTARNELIQWIENELSRAGESSEETDMDVQRLAPGHQGRNYIESELVSIHRQYARYSKARQELVIVAVGQLDSQATTNPDEHDALSLETLESDGSLNSTHLTYPYLEQMVSVLNEQKALIQQKSHITISLSKQLKEAGQGLDRQADESHLLPAYPMRAKVGPWKGPESSNSFADEISNYEKPDSSQRAQAWVHSSASAANATKESILEKLEEGSMAIDDTRQILIELQRLLGVDNLVSLEDVENTSKSQDIWAGIDGNLSVIKNDKGDAV